MDGTAPATRATTSRRTLLAIVTGVAPLLLATVTVRITLLEKILWTEDFLPGAPPDMVLEPDAWSITGESITFAVLGDNGSGGRNAMAVVQQMARTYQKTPYGLVLLAGDISYYGSIDDRWEQVFVEPYGPLIDAGITWKPAIGNHEIEEKGNRGHRCPSHGMAACRSRGCRSRHRRGSCLVPPPLRLPWDLYWGRAPYSLLSG